MVAVMKDVSDCCNKDGWELMSEEVMDEREKIEMPFERNRERLLLFVSEEGVPALRSDQTYPHPMQLLNRSGRLCRPRHSRSCPQQYSCS
jgi:hypothetical protein